MALFVRPERTAECGQRTCCSSQLAVLDHFSLATRCLETGSQTPPENAPYGVDCQFCQYSTAMNPVRLMETVNRSLINVCQRLIEDDVGEEAGMNAGLTRMSMGKKRVRLTLCSIAAVVAACGSATLAPRVALAHAVLVSAQPAENSVVTGPDVRCPPKIQFTDRYAAFDLDAAGP